MTDAVTPVPQPEAVNHREPEAMAFSFGDPEPVINSRMLWDMGEALNNGRWYEWPIPPEGLVRSLRSNPHHSSAIYLKRNMLTSRFIPHPLLSRAEFSSMALDYLVTGNAFLERRRNMIGGTARLLRAPARYCRRGLESGQFWWVTGYRLEQEFERDSVCQIMEPDVAQEVYGCPDYLAGLQAAWLNENATLFRRRYYTNGAHTGFILYSTDAEMSDEHWATVKEQLRKSKGPGNFSNIALRVPQGKPDGLKIITLAEAMAKDEFANIKNASMDDVLAAHRVPPQLLGVMPRNNGGFGNVIDATNVFLLHEIMPLIQKMEEFNHWLGEEVITFEPIKLIVQGAAGASAGG